MVCTAARLAKKIAFEGSSSMAALYDASASSSFPIPTSGMPAITRPFFLKFSRVCRPIGIRTS